MSVPIRVLVVDDSHIVRTILSRQLNRDPMIEIVGTASGAYQARDKIVELRPGVLTLDIEMPDMDGLQFLSKLMPQYPLPVIIVSSIASGDIAIRALSIGAVDVVLKPSSNGSELDNMILELQTKIKIAATVDVSRWKGRRVPLSSPSKLKPGLGKTWAQIIAIGASTGGVEAIRRVLVDLPPNLPPIVITQHIPPMFSKSFADRLNELGSVIVKEAEDGELLHPGHAYIAPGAMHLRVVKNRNGVGKISCEAGEPYSGHCPSVDLLHYSVAEAYGPHAIGFVLTGMGQDGARGLLAIRQAGGLTVSQDEASSVVYGMPRAAWELGAAVHQISLSNIPEFLLRTLSESSNRAKSV